MPKVTKVDFTKFTKKTESAKTGSSSDNMGIYLLKTMMPSISKKIKCLIGVAIYFLIIGLISNFYFIYILFKNLFS